MSVKRINYIVFALLLISLISDYLFMYSSLPIESRRLIYIPTLALMISSVIVLIYQQQLQELRLKFNTLFNDRAAKSWIGTLSDVFIQAFHDVPESLVILNHSLKVIYHNKSAAKIFGIENGQIYSDETANQDSPFEKKQLRGIKQVLTSGKKWEDQQTLYINGEAKTYLHRINPIYENGLVEGIIICSSDISPLIQSRKDAEAANMAKNQFLTNISHELRTPLIGILGAVELLERSAMDGFETDNIKIISDCGEQLLEIINKILDVSRMGLGTAACQPGECNLRNILNQTLSSVYPAIYEKGLNIEVHIDHSLPDYVAVDHAKLQQILLNILYNAVKFTQQGGINLKLHYTKSPASSWITISISDTGIGIPEDQLSKIFSPFSQVDNTSSREYQGIGLGLYLCKELVDLMNGELWIESEPNQGSTFYIKFPVEDIIDQPLPDSEEKTRTHDPINDLLLGFTPVKILVVDDNELTRKIVCQTLHNYGFQTGSAGNGLEGFDMLQKSHYDLVLMDMQMPLRDGYDTTLLIRSHDQFSSLPIIAMTANSANDAREKCLSCGCNAYIAKPFKADELIYEINKCIKDTPDNSDCAAKNDLIAELIPEFLDSLCESIHELDEAVKNNNIQEVKSISHDIKGSAGLYGFHEISHTAARIEQAAGENEPHTITNSFSQLRDLYKKLGA